MLLLNLSTFRYLQFLQRDYLLHGTSIDQIQMTSFQVLENTFPLRALLWFCLLVLLDFLTTFQLFTFPFSQVHTIISSFFAEIGGKYSSIFNVATLKSWVYHRLNVFKLPGTVYHNRSSQMILVNDANYIHVLPIFSTSLSPFICKYESIINHSNSSYFATNIDKLFSSNKIIDIYI